MKFHKVYVNTDGSLSAGDAVFGASPTLGNLENDMNYEDFGLMATMTLVPARRARPTVATVRAVPTASRAR